MYSGGAMVPSMNIVTMGVDQVGVGVEVSVIEWRGNGDGQESQATLLEGAIDGSVGAAMVAVIARQFGVTRALVDPYPNARLAHGLRMELPAVFAVHSGQGRNAHALAVIARERMKAIVTRAQAGPEVAQVTELEAVGDGTFALRMYLPDDRVPTRMVLPLPPPAVVLQQPSGARIVEWVGGLDAFVLEHD